jgi:hypothetical protein
MDLDDATYTLTGITLNSQVLRNYYSLLLQDNRFKTVELSNIKRNEGGYTFTLRASKYTQ